jgi:hypothetical protein
MSTKVAKASRCVAWLLLALATTSCGSANAAACQFAAEDFQRAAEDFDQLVIAATDRPLRDTDLIWSYQLKAMRSAGEIRAGAEHVLERIEELARATGKHVLANEARAIEIPPMANLSPNPGPIGRALNQFNIVVLDEFDC